MFEVCNITNTKVLVSIKLTIIKHFIIKTAASTNFQFSLRDLKFPNFINFDQTINDYSIKFWFYSLG